MRQVIHIFGAAGSGTSTLGRYLSEKLGFFHMDTDDYFWERTAVPFTVKRDREQRLALMKRDLETHDGVVLSGSLNGWGDPLIPYFTLAVRLETDAAIRLERLKSREHSRFGDRLEPGGDMYENHLEFLRWAASYDTGGMDMRSKASHDAWQQRLTCPVLTLDGSAELTENFRIIRWKLWAEKEKSS